MPAAIISKKSLVPNHAHMIPAAAARAPKNAAIPITNGRVEGAKVSFAGLAMVLS